MKLILGLGNPGEKYKKTRHNAGFLAVDFLCGFFKVDVEKYLEKFDSHFYKISVGGKEIIMAKPQTFMNLSGKTAAAFKNFYKLETLDILVLQDELDLPLGETKLSISRGAAGHNGILNIFETLSSKDFWRLRIGVENRDKQRGTMKGQDFLLSNFSEDELQRLQNFIFPEKLLPEVSKWITS